MRTQRKPPHFSASIRANDVRFKVHLWVVVIAAVAMTLLVARSMIRGVHGDQYASPTWMVQLSTR